MKNPTHVLHSRRQPDYGPAGSVRGFTIIEVMIVLALAGIIMLIVLVAVPTLSQVSRDTGRKSAATQTLAQLDVYRTNNALVFPGDAQRCQFLLDYMSSYIPAGSTCTYNAGKDCMYVKGNRFDFCFHTGTNSPHSYFVPNSDEISMQTGHWCTVSRVTAQPGDPIQSSGNDSDLRYIAVWIPLERARMICLDNRS
jgi:prepilin-type N-terminal cleavage/methylation domain-containing protein